MDTSNEWSSTFVESQGFENGSPHEGETQSVRKLTAPLREYGNIMLSQQLGHVAAQVSKVGSAIRHTATKLEAQQDPTLSGYAEAVAEQVENMADYLGSSSPEQIFAKARQFSRGRPELIIGGMFIGGLILARFLKSETLHTMPLQNQRASDPHPFPSPIEAAGGHDPYHSEPYSDTRPISTPFAEREVR